MDNPKTLSLVIPCYNEERTLLPCVKRVLAIATTDLKLEVVIVDDCSTDKSLAVARDMAKRHPEVTVLHHDKNRGKGAALRTGFIHATGDFVGVQDADMEYDPQEYHILLQPILANKADVVFGSRYLKSDTRRVLYFWHTWMNQTVPIRLTQTPPRCRVFPCAGIEVGIGRGLGVTSRNAEQRTEGVERVETPIEAERELVEVGLEMLRAHAMVDAVEPGLQVGEDEVDHRHELFGNLGVAAFGNCMMVVASLA